MRSFNSNGPSDWFLYTALMRRDSHKSKLADLERAFVLRGENRLAEIEELRLRIAEQGRRQSISLAVYLFLFLLLGTLFLYFIQK